MHQKQQGICMQTLAQQRLVQCTLLSMLPGQALGKYTPGSCVTISIFQSGSILCHALLYGW